MTIVFDGGTPCNIPRLGFGDGYGSYRIDDREIVRLKFGVPMSNNAAEISTLVEAIKKARELGATSLFISGDSQIALAWVDRCTGARKPKKKVSGTPAFLESINRLSIALFGISAQTHWRSRDHSVRIFGH